MIESVRSETDTFAGYDGTALFERRWLPVGAPRAALAIVHGYAEHSGRYAYVGEQLAARGYAVYAFDLRGHGRSGGRRVLVRSFGEYLADLRIFLRRVSERHPRAPLFLLGHSMGGGIVALGAVVDPPRVDGLLLSGAVLASGAAAPSFVRRIVAALGRLFPALPMHRLAAEAVSRDPAVQHDYDSDPLVYRGRMRAGLASAMIRAAKRMDAGMETIALPLLIMHGSADTLVSLEGSRRLYARAASPDKTLTIYEGLYHEILNEPERDQVIDDIARWMEDRARRAASA